MSVLLERRAKLETLSYEPFTGRDGQGAPTYGSSISFEARVEERDTVIRGSGSGTHFVIDADGNRVNTPLTLYVPGDEDNIPDERDRITMGSDQFIARERTPIRGLRVSRSEPEFVRLRCSDE